MPNCMYFSTLNKNVLHSTREVFSTLTPAEWSLVPYRTLSQYIH